MTTSRDQQCPSAVAIDWLARQPDLPELQRARDDLGAGTFRAAMDAYGRAREGVLDEQRRAAWSDVELPFDQPDGRGVG